MEQTQDGHGARKAPLGRQTAVGRMPAAICGAQSGCGSPLQAWGMEPPLPTAWPTLCMLHSSLLDTSLTPSSLPLEAQIGP